MWLQGERIPFDMQLNNHQTIILRLVELLGTESAASWYLSKCLYTVGLGNNDYINNYFMPQHYNSSRDYTLEEYTELLINQYTRQIKVRAAFIILFCQFYVPLLAASQIRNLANILWVLFLLF